MLSSIMPLCTWIYPITKEIKTYTEVKSSSGQCRMADFIWRPINKSSSFNKSPNETLVLLDTTTCMLAVHKSLQEAICQKMQSIKSQDVSKWKCVYFFCLILIDDLFYLVELFILFCKTFIFYKVLSAKSLTITLSGFSFCV